MMHLPFFPGVPPLAVVAPITPVPDPAQDPPVNPDANHPVDE